jgi:hypothetical protein
MKIHMEESSDTTKGRPKQGASVRDGRKVRLRCAHRRRGCCEHRNANRQPPWPTANRHPPRTPPPPPPAPPASRTAPTRPPDDPRPCRCRCSLRRARKDAVLTTTYNSLAAVGKYGSGGAASADRGLPRYRMFACLHACCRVATTPTDHALLHAVDVRPVPVVGQERGHGGLCRGKAKMNDLMLCMRNVTQQAMIGPTRNRPYGLVHTVKHFN